MARTSLTVLEVSFAAVALFATVLSPPVGARELTFEERVRAQEALERVYHSHQIGTTGSFEKAVPRDVLEGKVRTYLKQSVALETLWNTPVTSTMLERELERMARGTRMPDRLREMYAALGNDAFLIQQCLARPALVDRLTRNFFAFDSRFHARAGEEAAQLRENLARRGIAAFDHDARRSEVEIVEDDGADDRGRAGAGAR